MADFDFSMFLHGYSDGNGYNNTQESILQNSALERLCSLRSTEAVTYRNITLRYEIMNNANTVLYHVLHDDYRAILSLWKQAAIIMTHEAMRRRNDDDNNDNVQYIAACAVMESINQRNGTIVLSDDGDPEEMWTISFTSNEGNNIAITEEEFLTIQLGVELGELRNYVE